MPPRRKNRPARKLAPWRTDRPNAFSRTWLSWFWKALGIAATAIGYAAAVWLLLSKRLDAAFDNRLAPYDLLAQAQNLERREQWDEAAAVYRSAQQRIDSSRATPALTYLVYDGLLHSVANTAAPERFSPELTLVEARVGPRIPRTGYRLHELGYYYLRTGDTAKARQYLTEWWALRRKNGERSDAAYNQYNLGVVATAEGDVPTAVAYLRGAIADNPGEFHVDDPARYLSEDDRWLREMRGLYGAAFGDRWRAVADSLRRVVAPRGGPSRDPTRR